MLASYSFAFSAIRAEPAFPFIVWSRFYLYAVLVVVIFATIIARGIVLKKALLAIGFPVVMHAFPIRKVMVTFTTMLEIQCPISFFARVLAIPLGKDEKIFSLVNVGDLVNVG
jgi:hypothetical protein